MKPKDKDRMREWFADMPDETLPFDFNEKLMVRIEREATVREKRNKRWAIFGYTSGAVAMLTVCVAVLYYMGISFEWPAIEPRTWTFPKADYDIFGSQSFLFSVYVGMLALFLLILDSVIRHRIGKTKHPE